MASIGTLFAYTMVAIAVLVTRYTPGVQSVALEKGGIKEKTNKCLKTICCRPEETEDKDEVIGEVSYQKVPSNDEEYSSNMAQPDEETSFRVRVGAFVLTLSITTLTICLTHAHSQLGRGEAWTILLCCSFGLTIVASLIFILR